MEATSGEEGNGREEILYAGAGVEGSAVWESERRVVKLRGTAVQPYLEMEELRVVILDLVGVKEGVGMSIKRRCPVEEGYIRRGRLRYT